MGTRKWIRLLFLLFLVGAVATSVFPQVLPPDYDSAVPQELRWALFGAPTVMLFAFPDVPGGGPIYTIVTMEPGSRMIPSDSWKPNNFLRRTTDGRYRVLYRTTVIYRFDHLRLEIPKEPVGHSEDIRRWLVSEPICITVEAGVPAAGWFKEKYRSEGERFLKGLEERYLRDNEQSDPELVTPALPAMPATEVRFRTGPRRGPFFNLAA